MPVCRVLWLDLKGTTAALLREPETLQQRLSIFYSFCESIVTDFDPHLGNYRSFNFSDTYALLLYSNERDIPSRVLVEVADRLIDKFRSQAMVVRAFITRGVEGEDPMDGLRPIITRAGGEPIHQVLFGVNTAVVAAGQGEYAHLPGHLLVDEAISRTLGEKVKETFFVDAKGRGYREDGGTYTDVRSGKASAVQGPGYIFHRIR